MSLQSLFFLFLSHQLAILRLHLVDGVLSADILSCDKLGDVFAEMFLTHLVRDAHNPAFNS